MFEELQRRVTPYLDRAYNDTLQELFVDCFHPVREMLTYHYHTGGKRLRPLCVFVAAEAFRAKHKEWSQNESGFLNHLLPFAVAVEMIHNATLVHDDIQDGDEFRRGQPTLWKRYSVPQAINCGDLLFFLSQRMVDRAPYQALLKLGLLQLLQEQTQAVILGQMEEFSLKERLLQQGVFPSAKNYEIMAKGKTAALFELPLLGGALLMGAGDSQLQELKNSSTALGLAFQIQDDLLDLWGKKGRTKTGSDIAEGKLSYLAVRGHELLLKAKRFSELEQFKKILVKAREDTSSEDIVWCTVLLEEVGAKEVALERMDALLSAARTQGALEAVTAPIIAELEKLIQPLR